MKILFLCFFFFTSMSLMACEFKPEKGVVSFSAPMTSLFIELGLIKSKKLKAISSFHPFKEIPQTVERIKGGLFVSPKSLKPYQGSTFFIDQSHDLRRLLKRVKVARTIEIRGRDKGPFQVFQQSLKQLKPFIAKCDEQIKKLELKIGAIKKRLTRHNFSSLQAVFFLGRVKPGERMPNTIMVNDGPVLFLKNKNKLKTYPSELSYVSWSEKVLKRLERKNELLLIGLSASDESMRLNLNGQEGRRKYFNFEHPFIFLPGLPQIYALESLSTSLTKKLGINDVP